MNEQDDVRLRHMLEAAQEAVSFAKNRTREELDTNRMLVLALVKDIEIIGEAASRISEACQTTYPHIPWADIIGMRNRLIHAYFNINLNIVWDTITANLIPLIAELEQILPPDKEAS